MAMMEAESKLRVGVLFGGRSGEHEVSLMSARSILAALDAEKYTITQIGITHDGAWLTGENVLESMLNAKTDKLVGAALLPDPSHPGLYRIPGDADDEKFSHLADLDVIFPVLHGTFGEDGTLQGFLEMADLAYVGAGVLGSSLGMDKGIFKDVMRFHGIPILDWMVTTRKQIEKDVDTVVEQAMLVAPFPLFVKPANLGSSVGVSKCISRSDLLEGLFEASRYDRRVIVERGVNAREIEVSVLGNEEPRASVPGEVIPSREFYSYEAKYVDDRSELLIPAPIPAELARKVQEFAVDAYKAIDCAGMARVDFLLERTGPSGVEPGELYLNELNTIPGFTHISMYPKLWEASGLPYPSLVDRLIELALERKGERDRTERRYLGGNQDG
jgi:D-alanine-D-alanine ligase